MSTYKYHVSELGLLIRDLMSLITPELCSTNFKLASQLGAGYVVNFQVLNEAEYHHHPRPP